MPQPRAFARLRQQLVDLLQDVEAGDRDGSQGIALARAALGALLQLGLADALDGEVAADSAGDVLEHRLAHHVRQGEWKQRSAALDEGLHRGGLAGLEGDGLGAAGRVAGGRLVSAAGAAVAALTCELEGRVRATGACEEQGRGESDERTHDPSSYPRTLGRRASAPTVTMLLNQCSSSRGSLASASRRACS